MVQHEIAYAAAARHAYPMAVIRLALNMYRGQRRIAWHSTVSREMFSEAAVVAGCALAMHLLALIAIDPIDEFLKVAPRSLRLFRLYVDDFMSVFATSGSCGPQLTCEEVLTEAASATE
eukprot:12406120-Karenia_brevis.AAC.1